MRARYHRLALWLAVFTIAYNLVEGGVSIAFGVEEESLSVLSFGIDSLIEVFSAVFVLWAFFGRRGGLQQAAPAELRRERIATMAIGLLLVALAVGTVAGGVYRLVKEQRPGSSSPGIGIAAVSLSFMWALWYWKTKTALMLRSSTVLLADAACSMDCIKLSTVLLIGAILVHIDDVLWWVDAAASLIIALFIAWEAGHTVRAAYSSDFSGCGCAHSDSWLARRMRPKLYAGNGTLARAVERTAAVLADPSLSQSGARLVEPVAVLPSVDEFQDQYVAPAPPEPEPQRACAVRGS